MTEFSREQQLASPPLVRLDISGAPLLNGTPPTDDPRAYGMTDAEAEEWNRMKSEGLVGVPTNEEIAVLRRNLYAEVSDPLFFGWQRGENTEQEWLDSIQQIKDENPYAPS